MRWLVKINMIAIPFYILMTIHLVRVLPISCTSHFMKKCVTFEKLKYLVVLVENVQEHRTGRERWDLMKILFDLIREHLVRFPNPLAFRGPCLQAPHSSTHL